MIKQRKGQGPSSEIPEAVDRVTTVATVTITQSDKQATNDLIEEIREKIGGFDERVHYGGRVRTNFDSLDVSTVITVNSIASHSPMAAASTENSDDSDEIRVNSEAIVPPGKLNKGLASSFFKSKSISDSLDSQLRKKGEYSFIVKTHDNNIDEIDFGCNGLTNRTTTNGGYLAESFGNKVKLKQVPETEVNRAISDLTSLVIKKWDGLY